MKNKNRILIFFLAVLFYVLIKEIGKSVRIEQLKTINTEKQAAILKYENSFSTKNEIN